jgi:hypothetical protein
MTNLLCEVRTCWRHGRGIGIYRLYELMIGANPATDSHETMKSTPPRFVRSSTAEDHSHRRATQANPRP